VALCHSCSFIFLITNSYGHSVDHLLRSTPLAFFAMPSPSEQSARPILDPATTIRAILHPLIYAVRSTLRATLRYTIRATVPARLHLKIMYLPWAYPRQPDHCWRHLPPCWRAWWSAWPCSSREQPDSKYLFVNFSQVLFRRILIKVLFRRILIMFSFLKQTDQRECQKSGEEGQIFAM